MAVKKIMKPFSTPVLAKRTYRELKLLKHLKHENVCTAPSRLDDQYEEKKSITDTPAQVISLSDIFISPLEDMYVGKLRLIKHHVHVFVTRQMPNTYVLQLLNCSAPISTASSHRDH